MTALPCVILDFTQEFDSSEAAALDGRRPRGPADVRLEDRRVLVWAERYAFATRRLLPDLESGTEAARAAALIACSSFFAAAKVYRALVGLAHDAWLDPRDARESAAVAILALDRSRDAWLTLLDAGLVDGAAVGDLLTDLVQVRAALLVAVSPPGIE